jgi:hypothetical protein
MTTLSLLTRTHLENALTPTELRATKIVRIALMSGILPFYFVIILLYLQNGHAGMVQTDTSLMGTLSLIHACFALIAAGGAFYLPKIQMRKEYLSRAAAGLSVEKIAAKAVQLHRASTVMMMAPIEGAAFFGGAICMIGVVDGTMGQETAYWLNTLSGVVLVGIGLLTFPTRENVLGSLERAFL